MTTAGTRIDREPPPPPDPVPLALFDGELVSELRARWGAPRLVVYDAVASTNDVARELAAGGAVSGTVVMAERQFAGRGRAGRRWFDAPGRSVLLSYVMRPRRAAFEPAVIPLRVGLAAALVLEAIVGRRIEIKWPNDLLIDGLKVGGILCEAASQGGRTPFVVIGVGINVLQSRGDWPAELADQATSLLAATGERARRAVVAERVVAGLRAIDNRAPRLGEHELAGLAKRDPFRDRNVVVDDDLTGTARGFTSEGALRLEDHEGRIRRILAGTLRLATPPATPTRT